MTKQEFIAWALLQGGTVSHSAANRINEGFYTDLVHTGFMREVPVGSPNRVCTTEGLFGLSYAVTKKGLELMK